MNRRGFLRGLGLAVAAVAVAPAMKLLIEENTVCTGLLYHINKSGIIVTYNDRPTLADFDELIRTLDNNYMGMWDGVSTTAPGYHISWISIVFRRWFLR